MGLVRDDEIIFMNRSSLVGLSVCVAARRPLCHSGRFTLLVLRLCIYTAYVLYKEKDVGDPHSTRWTKWTKGPGEAQGYWGYRAEDLWSLKSDGKTG